MTYRRIISVPIVLILCAIAMAGCSDENPVDLSDNTGASPATTIYDQTDLVNILGDMGSFKDLMDRAVVEKKPPLPEPLLLSTQAARAMGAIASGTWWEPETLFFVDRLRGAGFELYWLEDDPDSWDPDRYICNVFLEGPVGELSDVTFVDPNATYVEGAANRVMNVLADPEGLIGFPLLPGAIYDYFFAYPDPTSTTQEYQVFRLTRFYLHIN